MVKLFIAFATDTGVAVLETEAAKGQAPTLANATLVWKDGLKTYVRYWPWMKSM